ncbi:phosphotransferase system, mannose fructose N-acetylgalactosamine-specific component IIB [Lacticaseibacillus pantheris DSM 15945 = JCM 12539 = NBRC 106106]|uniref:Phosphotransferase system, mannose fructose N-acetylgalactosamine-specific component IIB n=2 Tax=Lacticaseibacillus pantheris TaxID=171523 RepID=A0A0R1U7F6_9LACO|nr:phosphotransferase system, mannose fructose N-acetylgalactosamine-specific component IIB [Lacticaseibacillus pantheris DSM 15945 = JCM 12539 = NBRC 106106]
MGNMAISFVRIDDRMIHGLITVRWGKEYPMDGIIAVNDKAANNPVLKEAYMAASDKKTFVWTLDHFNSVKDKVLNSSTRYFLITKNPQDMEKILVDLSFVPGDIKTVVVGPGNDRENAIKLGDNQSFTPEEAASFEAIEKAGYKVEFALLPDQRIGSWDKFKSRFGY